MEENQYLEKLVTAPKIFNISVSPDCKYVAWVFYEEKKSSYIYYAPTDGSSEPVQLTNDDKYWSIASWLPDSSGLLVTQESYEKYYQLHRVKLDSPGVVEYFAEPGRQATEDLYDTRNYVRGCELTPDGQWLIFACSYDFENKKETEGIWIYKQNLFFGTRVVLAITEATTYTFPSLNDQGTHILYKRTDKHPRTGQIWLVDIDGKEDREIIDIDDCFLSASWNADGTKATIRADLRTYTKVGIWQLENNQVDWVIDDPECFIEDAYLSKNQIIVTEAIDTIPKISFFNLENKSWSDNTNPLVMRYLVREDDDSWLATIGGPKQIHDLGRISSTGEYTSITDVWSHTKLKPEDIIEPENYHWQGEDNLKIQGWLWKPRVEVKGTVILVHGGPSNHISNRFNSEIQYYLSRGFNVLAPNYRGSTGLGQVYYEKIKEDGWGGKEQSDIILGIKSLINDGIAEEYKIGITGASYGGYSCWCAITRNPTSLVAVAAPASAMVDLKKDYETTWREGRLTVEKFMGGKPIDIPEKYAERSPVNYMQNIKAKILIVHGEKDVVVTISQVRAAEEKLKEYGIPYEKLIFETEGHDTFSRTDTIIEYKSIADFFEEAFSSSSAESGPVRESATAQEEA